MSQAEDGQITALHWEVRCPWAPLGGGRGHVPQACVATTALIEVKTRPLPPQWPSALALASMPRSHPASCTLPLCVSLAHTFSLPPVPLLHPWTKRGGQGLERKRPWRPCEQQWGSACALLQALRRPSSRSSLPRENKLCFPCFFPFKSSTMWSVPALSGRPPSVSDPVQGPRGVLKRGQEWAGAVLKPGIWGGLAKANPSCQGWVSRAFWPGARPWKLDRVSHAEKNEGNRDGVLRHRVKILKGQGQEASPAGSALLRAAAELLAFRLWL